MNLAAAVAAGLLLAASDQPLHWWWLQFVAFVPFWWSLWRRRHAGRHAWPVGVVFAAAYALVILLSAGPAPPVLAAATASLVQWALAALLAGRCLDRGAVRGPLAAAAMLTLVEVATWHLVPVFVVAYTGVGGLVFAVTALQALLVSALRGPARWPPLAVAGALVAAVAAMNAVRWTRPLGQPVRVAAFGWGTDTPQSPDGSFFVQIAAAMAAGNDCRLLVTPETGMPVVDGDNARRYFADLATLHPMPLAIGVWHGPTQDNRIWFLDARGALVAEYRKAHLVPFFEDYATGDGAPVVVPFAGGQLGGMICQDDNFTDVARGYGRAGVPIVAVPTNDWPAIREFHLENGIFRAIENGYAVVRAASAGVSALVSPRGEVLVRCDHVDDAMGIAAEAQNAGFAQSARLPGGRLCYGDLPLGDGVPTVYARFGDVPVLLGCAALVLISLRRRRAIA